MKRLLSAVALLAISATGSIAADNPKTIFVGVQVYEGTADLAPAGGAPNITGHVSAFDHSEYGFKFEYWNLMATDYALTASGSVGMFSEENQPTSSSPANTPTAKYTQSSWNFRLGGDRVVKPSERAYLFFGPGIEYWTGKAKFESVAGVTDGETENTTRVSLHGRIGAHMMIADNWGFTVQAGQKIGMATYEEDGAKSTWWPSSMDGSMGLVLKFGGGE